MTFMPTAGVICHRTMKKIGTGERTTGAPALGPAASRANWLAGQAGVCQVSQILIALGPLPLSDCLIIHLTIR
jgi:hypothetical protein